MSDKIELDNGKYVLTVDNGEMTTYRLGELWCSDTGDNLIFFLAMRVIELEAKASALEDRLQEAGWAMMGDDL